MTAQRSLMVIKFLPPRLSASACTLEGTMTLLLQYWLVLSGDSLLTLFCCLSSLFVFYNGDKKSANSLCLIFFLLLYSK
ncbi:hypothetical protein M422DRAFT_25178 [Sphaerobolus stellatus SS14]|nr:hypothetical protein M422DRAFT_25178 [Sphaerobolus stellatus SS14]